MAQATWRAKSLATAKSAGVPGILTLTTTGFRWAPNNPNAATPINADYSTIKSHRSSKEATSKKAMLNLLTDSPTLQYFFEFENFADRDACRNFLARFLPNTTTANSNQQQVSNQASTSASPNQAPSSENLSPPEVQRRIKLLQEDTELLKLHQQLVRTGILSEAEFWASRKRAGDKFQKQKTGLQSAMLADIRPSTDGRSNKVMFNLNPEIIHQIFAEKPAVHRAFLNMVPSKMSEVEFWTKYCRTEYLYRTKNAAAATAEAAGDEDLAVFINDDDIIANEARRKIRRVDPTLDIAADDADDYLTLPGHGIFRDGTNEPVDPKHAQARKKLMRDINRHAEVVLEGRHLAEDMNDTMTIAHALAKTQQQDNKMDADDDQAREERVHSMTEMEDLRGPRGPPVVPLSIQDPRKYFDVQTTATAGSSSYIDPNDVMNRFKSQLEQCKSKNYTNPVLPSSLAYKIVKELTQSISHTQHPLGKTAEKNVLDVLPPHVRDSLLQYQSVINELLVHFWASFPITSRTLQNKASRLKDSLSKIYTELQDLKNSVQSEHRHQVSLISQPILQTLDAALAYYEDIEKRTSKKSGGANGDLNGMVAVK